MCVVRHTEVTVDGDVRCPKCGARNQFTPKRTGKAKLMVVATGGVGVLATSKKLKCQGCGTNLKAS
jgi:DNA-directed RNA polymerase subunit RPC12/RpoP